jgi:hypothetical protein
MASLKALKMRIGSVKSTQKITKAMKMVAVTTVSFLYVMPASASSDTVQTTIGVYQTMLGSVSVMSNRFPKLQELRTAVAEECDKRILPTDDIKSAPGYCYCAGVVTTAVWMTYPDANLRMRLVDIMDKGQGNIPELAAYSSPDLYRSICKVVDADLAMQAHSTQAGK